jgi:hypothetical protein
MRSIVAGAAVAAVLATATLSHPPTDEATVEGVRASDALLAGAAVGPQPGPATSESPGPFVTPPHRPLLALAPGERVAERTPHGPLVSGATPADPRLGRTWWRCHHDTDGSLLPQSDRIAWTFAGGEAELKREFFTDAHCVTPTQTITVRYAAVVGGPVARKGDGRDARKLDLTVRTVALTLHDPDLVAKANQLALCGLSGWQAGAPRAVTGLACANTDELETIDARPGDRRYTAYLIQSNRLTLAVGRDVDADGTSEARRELLFSRQRTLSTDGQTTLLGAAGRSRRLP